MKSVPTTEQNKELVVRHVEEMWNRGELDAARDYCAENVVQHDPFTRRITSLDAYLKHLTDIRGAFPDLKVLPRDMVAEDDRVAMRWSFAGTNRAPLGGLPATGKRVAFDGMSVYRLAEGRIVEIWTSWDSIGYLRQLEALPGLAARG